MGLFNKVTQFFKGSAHRAVDKAIDPLVLAEQATREDADAVHRATESRDEVEAEVIVLSNKVEQLTKRHDDLMKTARQLKLRTQDETASAEDREKAKKLAIQILDDANKVKADLDRDIANLTNRQQILVRIDAAVEEAADRIENNQRDLAEMHALQKTAEAENIANDTIDNISGDSSGTSFAEARRRIELEAAQAKARSERVKRSQGTNAEEEAAKLLGGTSEDQFNQL